MAARLDQIVTSIERLLNPNQSAIELYRADFATPDTLEAMRFWAQGEYNRIQNGFGSTDDTVKLLANALSELIAAVDEIVESGGLEGPAGEDGLNGQDGKDGQDGQDGKDGNAGDLIDDNRTLYAKTWSSQKIAQELHEEKHTLDSHTDVTITDAAQDQSLVYDSGWKNGYRAQMLPYIEGSTYYPQNTVYVDGWLMVANKETTEFPAPIPVGAELYLYEGDNPTAQDVEKQLIFGTRYGPTAQAIYANGYRVYAIIGNEYTVYTVRDPDGAAVINTLITFTATSSGWREFAVNQGILEAGSVFDLLVVVAEPDPAPVTFTGNWNYTTPNNVATPLSGQVVQANQATSEFRIHKTDNDAVDRSAEIDALTVGDIIDWGNGGIRWAIQSIQDNGTWATLGVAPATQESPDGVNNFTFETTAAAPITYLSDPDYWLTSPYTVQGRLQLGNDPSITNDTAYGADLLVQEVDFSEDWDAFGIPSSTSGGGGGGGAQQLQVMEVLRSESFIDQDPTGLGVAYQVTFGPPETNEFFSVDAAGAVTCITPAEYDARIKVVVGREGAGGESQIYLRFLVNGVQAGNSTQTIVDNARIEIPQIYDGTVELAAGDVMTFEIIRDTDGADAGGLRAGVPDVAGWNPSPSASLVIKTVRT